MEIKSLLFSTPLKKIIFFVTCIHIAMILCLTFSKSPKERHKKILVKTIYPKIEQPIVKKIDTPVQNTIKKKLKPTRKNTSRKKKSNTKPVSNPTFTNKTNNSFKLNESIDFLTANEPAPLPTHSKIPAKILKLKIEEKNETIMDTSKISYENEIAGHLQNLLSLPEIGKVKAELIITAIGKVTHIKILESQSNKNEAYLKNQLLKLNFPCFNDYNISDKQLTLIVNFNNK
ncbi:MAG: hypothetical protein COT84_08620 [Chlamydiae bacterium CG10_big_fil_rev_8_21_14_0_10_35_9]|nr:MAG: hypothetical protein COT84_08620 [Chlamydiae bacterium CG10_big_fil_rev_8_21_14_0_10_35_9]